MAAITAHKQFAKKQIPTFDPNYRTEALMR
jgi:hypothetical protein